jgi:2-desacetyl-2-hydroxyethyl bacteriochlorophyllide A dehydrogenase
MKAHAIVFRAANTPSLEEIDIPALKEDEILVKIHYSGVSIGTESSIFSGARTHNGTFPLVGGYMASGEVVSVGAEVKTFVPGDMVAALGARMDGEVNSIWGGHSSMQVVSQDTALKLPAGARPEEAALFILPSVGLNAVTMAGVTENDTVLIQGQGLIGQFFGQWCVNRGAKVIAIEPAPDRAALSRKYVSENVLSPSDPELEKKIAELTGGKGPSVVTEATASAKLIPNATKFLSMDGKMVFLSWYPGNISLDFAHFHNQQVTACFPMGAGDVNTWRAVLQCLASGALKIGDNLSDLLDYTEACAGYERLIAGDRSVMGMVFDWRKSHK